MHIALRLSDPASGQLLTSATPTIVSESPFKFCGCVGFFVTRSFLLFPQETEAHDVHLVGAIGGFVFGNAYCWLQTLLSFRLAPAEISTRLAVVRLALSIVGAATLVSSILAGN